jgi:hypothetical protein
MHLHPDGDLAGSGGPSNFGNGEIGEVEEEENGALLRRQSLKQDECRVRLRLDSAIGDGVWISALSLLPHSGRGLSECDPI